MIVPITRYNGTNMSQIIQRELPENLHEPSMTNPLIACCDLGGTKMLAGLVSPQGKLLASEKYLIGDRSAPETVIGDLDSAFDRMLVTIGRERSEIVALGLSSTGVMNVETGLMYMNHNLGWLDVPLRDLAAQHFGVPVALEMDANAAALGEFWQGAARGLNSFAFVIVGTGIGAGLVLNGQVWHGARCTAGEIGHTVIVPGGPLCGCGKHGCLEALSSGLAIVRKAEAAIKLGRDTTLRTFSPAISGQQVTEAARAGDAVAVEIMDEAAYYLGIGLSNLITLLDPQAIVLGGGIGWGAFDLLRPRLHSTIQQHLNYWAARDLPILRSQLVEQAGLLGAAWAALNLISYPIIAEA